MFCFTAKCLGSLIFIYFFFTILHKIVAINNVQQCIRLNKQKEKKKFFALLLVSHDTHPGHLLLAHGRMEETF